MKQHLRQKTFQQYQQRFWYYGTIICIFGCIAVHTLCAHPTDKHLTQDNDSALSKDSSVNTTQPSRTQSDTGQMGIFEKLGSQLPLNLPFYTETGDTILLENLIHGPTILCFLFYNCKNACNLLITSIGTVLQSTSQSVGPDPKVIMISIDEHETPAVALRTKTMAFETLQKPFPHDNWRFLTGPHESIHALTDASGFHFVRKGDDFDHPLGLIIISQQGKIMRYIMGTDYLPMDITMSLMEASRGMVQPTIARVLRACFSYDPQSRTFVFRILNVSATVIIGILSIFIIYLIVSGKNRRAKEQK